MVARLIDGNGLASLVQREIKKRVDNLGSNARVPGLGVILAGNNPASKAYVSRKEKVAHSLGFNSVQVTLSEEALPSELDRAIDEFNSSSEIDGILLQLPLPKHLNAGHFIDRIAPAKDVDGLHAINQGKLMRGEEGIRPCTPAGILRLIDLALSRIELQNNPSYSDIPGVSLAGKKAIVIGRSILVGKPVSLLLLERNATVMMAHSKSPNLLSLVREADVVVAAVGVAGLVKGAWIKAGATVIDVGINRLPSGELTGDVEFAEAKEKAFAITPVPGGVGPMTVAMLMWNTLRCYESAR